MIKKKQIDEIPASAIVEFELTQNQREEFVRGIGLFNTQKYWEAHEAWEEVWKERSEDARIFLQGLIQAAAALHLMVNGTRLRGAMNNFDKSVSKLSAFPPHFLGIDVQRLRQDLRRCMSLSANSESVDVKDIRATGLPQLHFSHNHSARGF
jgi:hypothetical protein